MTEVADVAGVGFGPANLALAIALEEGESPLRSVFLEADPDPQWQAGMLLRGSDIQHNPHRDLVSLRNPRSRYSFMNYLHETGRLIEFLNLPALFPLRRDYADYIRWARRMVQADVRYGERVVGIALAGEPETGEALYAVRTSSGARLLARSIVLGPGRTPFMPELLAPLAARTDKVVHLQHYLPTVRRLAARPPRCVAVVGGSQSAVEIALDLVDRFPDCRIELISRSWSLRAKDHSPFSEEIYFPQFVGYYHAASPAARRRLDGYTRPTNYSAADLDVLERLYMEIHEQRLDGRQRVRLLGNASMTAAVDEGGAIALDLVEAVTGERSRVEADLVILATGFRDMGKGESQEPHHPLLSEVASHFEWTSEGHLDVAVDYSLVPVETACAPPIYLNGLCESTHGIGDAGSFSLLSLRAGIIARSLSRHLTGNAVPGPIGEITP